jgi:uncharacterized membrane protein
MQGIIDLYNATKEDISSGTFNASYLIIVVSILGIYYLMKLFLKYREETKNSQKTKAEKNVIIEELFASYLAESFLSAGVAAIFVIIFGVNGIIIGSFAGIVAAPIIENKIMIRESFVTRLSGKKQEEKKSSETTTPTSQPSQDKINVVINNNSNTSKDANNIDYFAPKLEELKDTVDVNNLDLSKILELYGYISQNQKYKMISSSLFETPDEQVKKLLDMPVLAEEEYKEAIAILNLIRLNKRLVTKEEAMEYILKHNQSNESRIEKRENNLEKKEGN